MLEAVVIQRCPIAYLYVRVFTNNFAIYFQMQAVYLIKRFVDQVPLSVGGTFNGEIGEILRRLCAIADLLHLCQGWMRVCHRFMKAIRSCRICE
jgi:hypothetical protein